jgi:hypothetical protein
MTEPGMTAREEARFDLRWLQKAIRDCEKVCEQKSTTRDRYRWLIQKKVERYLPVSVTLARNMNASIRASTVAHQRLARLCGLSEKTRKRLIKLRPKRKRK